MAPKVLNPLDVSAYVAEPCTVLTSAQLAEFNATEPGEADTEGAIGGTTPGCLWRTDHSPGWALGVAFILPNENGLSDIYRAKDTWEYFEPTTVQGYPAVFSALADARDSGICAMMLGVSDSLGISLQVQAHPSLGKESCAVTEKLANAVITTLKGA